MTSTGILEPVRREEQAAPTPRALYIDVIRALAIIGIVVIHIAVSLVANYNAGTRLWWAGNIYDGAARCAVPLFVMISGALLLDPAKQESAIVFFRKRFVRVFIPFAAWAIIYLAYRRYSLHEHLRPIGVIRELLTGPVYYHLWFIYMILGLYLVTPILRVYLRSARRTDQAYFVGFWFIGSCILPVTGQYLHFKFGIPILVVGAYVGYFMLGHFLRHSPSLSRGLLLTALAGATLFTLLVTYVLSRRAHPPHIDDTFYGYMAPNVAIAAIAIFLLARQLPLEQWSKSFPNIFKLVAALSSTSYSVYLMHALLIELFAFGKFGFRLGPATVNPFLGVPLVTFAVVSICMLATLLLRRIPGFRMIAA